MSTPVLKSWQSWPGFFLVACEGLLSKLYREITNSFLIFHGSLSTRRAQIQQEETLSVSTDQSATLKVPQSHTKFI